MSNRVLVLDANQRSALAVTRSLGKKGIKVFAGDSTKSSLAGSSRYCAKHINLPDPYTSPYAFIDDIADIITAQKIDLLLPMSDVSLPLVLKHKNRLPDVNIPFVDFNLYEKVSNKYTLFEEAIKLGVQIPDTYFIENLSQLHNIVHELKYPVVLKPALSRIFINDSFYNTSVSYAHSPEDIINSVATYKWFPAVPFMIQEYVSGQGQGIFVLYDNGKPLVFFSHKRIREKPPTGGVSVLCESVPVSTVLREATEALLTPLGWHGVAMVEFKVSSNGTPFLMEINARFWGSLQLSIDAGVDFPFMLYQIALGKSVTPVTQYNNGIRSRWLLGDLDRLYLLLKNANSCRSNFNIMKEVINFFAFFNRDTYYDTIKLGDLKPFLYELRKYIKDLF